MSFGNTSPNVSFGNITANISQGNITSTLAGAPVLADFLITGGGGRGGERGSLSCYMAYRSAAGNGGSGAVKFSYGSGATHTQQSFVAGTIYNIVVGGQAGTSSIIGGAIDVRAGGGGQGGPTSNSTTTPGPLALPDAANGGYLGGNGGNRTNSYHRAGQGANVTNSITGSSYVYGAIQPQFYNNMSYSDVTYAPGGSTYGQGGRGGATYENQCTQYRYITGGGAGGVVIVRFLTSGNTYVTTGATATTDGDYTVLTWTSGTRTLKFT